MQLCAAFQVQRIFSRAEVCRGTTVIVPCSIRQTAMVSANIHIQLNSAFCLELISCLLYPRSLHIFHIISAFFFPLKLPFSLTIRFFSFLNPVNKKIKYRTSVSIAAIVMWNSYNLLLTWSAAETLYRAELYSHETYICSIADYVRSLYLYFPVNLVTDQFMQW